MDSQSAEMSDSSLCLAALMHFLDRIDQDTKEWYYAINGDHNHPYSLCNILGLSFFQPLYLSLFLTIVFSYLLILVVYSWVIGLKNKKPAFMIGIPCAIMIMHFCWGSGLLIGMFTRPQKTRITDKLVG